MEVKERVEKLRKLMKEKGIRAYVIPTADFHQSESVGAYFKSREFLTGFDGSAGTAVITENKAGLWTDGRYFLQAEKQLQNTGIVLRRMGQENVPTILEYLQGVLEAGDVVGVDGRVLSFQEGREYEEILTAKGGRLAYEEDLVGMIWEERPKLPDEQAFALDISHAGESREDKLSKIREEMTQKGANVHLLTALDDICWTLNMRGNDVEYAPVVLSYGLITMREMKLYVDAKKIPVKLKGELEKAGVILKSYSDIYEDLKKLSEDDAILLDPEKVNYMLCRCIPEKTKRIFDLNPSAEYKMIKNATEICNIRKAQIKDSVAHVRFMKWLKECVRTKEVTELEAAEVLEKFRREMDGYRGSSFATISAWGEHGAIVHYGADTKSNAVLGTGSFFLMDAGAHFWEGTTDITRTYALGNVSRQKKEHFTMTVIANLSLANARFLEGSTGTMLDVLARRVFWEKKMDYRHGTGHGIGYFLYVHEGPVSIGHSGKAGYPLKAGMLLTDEPGVYVEGSHGVRLENDLLVCEGEKNEYGQFLYFEPLTWVPFDKDGMEPALMAEEEKRQLNCYHAEVYRRLAPYLTEEERAFLEQYTAPI